MVMVIMWRPGPRRVRTRRVLGAAAVLRLLVRLFRTLPLHPSILEPNFHLQSKPINDIVVSQEPRNSNHGDGGLDG